MSKIYQQNIRDLLDTSAAASSRKVSPRGSVVSNSSRGSTASNSTSPVGGDSSSMLSSEGTGSGKGKPNIRESKVRREERKVEGRRQDDNPAGRAEISHGHPYFFIAL